MGIEHSQNYLHSKQLVATLLSKSNICNDDIIIEIGPGKGIITIELAKKTLQAPRYSLGFLNEFLNIHHQNLHRAFQDTKTTLEVFKICLQNIPTNLYTSKDLLEFIKISEYSLKCATIFSLYFRTISSFLAKSFKAKRKAFAKATIKGNAGVPGCSSPS